MFPFQAFPGKSKKGFSLGMIPAAWYQLKFPVPWMGTDLWGCKSSSTPLHLNWAFPSLRQEDITAFGVSFAQQAQPAKLNSGLCVRGGPDCSTASGIYMRNLFRK